MNVPSSNVPKRNEFQEFARWVWNLPFAVKVFAAMILLIYVRVVFEAQQMWARDDAYSHGYLIFPIVLALLWADRAAIRQARPEPTAMGLPIIAVGLLLQVMGFLLRLVFVSMVSLPIVLAGTVLLLHGKELWKAVRFPICFLFFAAPLPGILLSAPSQSVQSISTSGAAASMKGIGYPILQTGNILELPGVTLEVAEVCSGFRKLFALVAFASLYGYLFNASPGRRMILLLSAVPIAIVANILRISGLIAVASEWGLPGLHRAHDGAEVVVVVLAYTAFALLGKALGCKTVRYA